MILLNKRREIPYRAIRDIRPYLSILCKYGIKASDILSDTKEKRND